MDQHELIQLEKSSVQEVIETHLEDDVTQFALRANPELPVTAIANQLALLKKAKLKLPSWYTARCLFTVRAFAQATNEAVLAARIPAFGQKAIDLTSGLGVDVCHLSQSHDEVVYNDLDPHLCALAKVNFRRLGRGNIRISNADAGALLAEQAAASVDHIFIDPDRRDAKGQRQAAFADCQPNVLALMPAMLACLRDGGTIMIKASPMLDVEEGIRQLEAVAPAVSAQVIAVDNEVKEVLFVVEKNAGASPFTLLSWNRKGQLGNFKAPSDKIPFLPVEIPLDPTPQYLLEPDVAFYKGRLTTAFLPQVSQGEIFANHGEGYYFSDAPVDGFPGKTFRIKAIWPYKPKQIKSALKREGISRVEIGRRYFDIAIGKVYQQLGMKEGGNETLLCTKQPDGNRLAVWCERIS